MLSQNVLKLRKECFGGTLFDIISGKRVYISNAEFDNIKHDCGLSAHLVSLLGVTGSVEITEPPWIPDFNFSAPDTVFFEVTRACNLRCIHCFNDSGTKLKDELNQEARLTIIDDLARTGVQEIRFTGGEPMVLNGIEELLYRAASLHLRVSMGTNAVLATANRVANLARFLHIAIVSIDGMEDGHDSIRGKGSFRKTIEGIQNFLTYGVEVRVNTVIMRSNTHETIELAKYLYDRGIPLFIRRFIPSGRAIDNANETLDKKDYDDLRTKLSLHLENPSGLTKGHYLSEERAIHTRVILPFLRNNCSAGHRGMVILPTGNTQTCGFLGPLGEMSVGKIHEESMSSIWKRLLMSDHIASLEKNLLPHNNCSTGPRTNCLAIALATQGNRLLTKGKL